MADKDVTTKLTLQGDSTGLVASMQKAEAQIKSFDGAMANVSGSIGKLTGIVGAVTAVLAGGAMFQEVVDATNKWTGEAIKLSRILGITTQEASILNVALGDVYLSMDVMASTALTLNKNTLKNTEAFSHYGIALKDSNGQQRNTLEIMNDVNAKLLTIKEGRDRELAGLQLYGKGWDSARGTLKLTAEVMEDAKRKAEELHLVVGPEAVANTKAYKAALNDVDDIWMAMKIQVGNQLLPILTRLGVWFNDIGPAGLEIFTGALKGVVTFGQFAALGIITLYETAKAGVNQVITLALTTNDVLGKILTGDFEGAAASAKSGWKEIADEGDKFADRITAATARTNDSLAKMWGFKPTKPGKGKPEAPEQSGVDLYDKSGGDKASAAVATEQAMLAAVLAGYKNRGAAQKDYATTSTLEWEYFYRTGMMMESEFQEKKYQIDRAALTNTIDLLNQESVAIEASLKKQIELESDPAKQAKLTADAKKATTDKIAEKEKLNQELYRLDVKYQTDSELLQTQTAIDNNATLSMWAAARAQNLNEELKQTREFEARKAAIHGDSFQMQMFQLDQEQKALEQSWAMNVDSYAEYERRKQDIAEYYAEKKKQTEMEIWQQNLGYASRGTGAMVSLTNSLVTLTGKKSKEMFILNKAASMADAAVNTALGVTSALAKVPPPYNFVVAGLVAAAGLAQQAVIASTNIGSGGGGSTAGLSGTGGGTPGSPMVTQPVSATPPQQAQVIQIHLNGTTLADPQALTRWSEDYLMPTIRDLKTRGVTA